MTQRAAITALGCNTSLGGALSACAAMRANLSRPAELPAMVFDSDEGAIPVTGHPVPTAAGFQGEARLLSLALPALRDLMSSVALPPGAPLFLCVALPDLEARGKIAGMGVPRRLGLLDRMVQHSGLPVAPQARHGFPAGPVGLSLAVEAALGLLANVPSATCLVGGVDTLCDDLAIEALAAEGRLKTRDNPAGVQPGEAAAFLLLEAPASAHRRRVKVLGYVGGFGNGQDPAAKNRPALGKGLFQAIRQLAVTSGPLPEGESWFVLDRNGETRRAVDWGYCQQHLAAQMKGLVPAKEWDPAVSLGDTGAANGAIAAQCAVRGFMRGYAPGGTAVILCSSEDGRRAAVRVDRGS
jgi:3-oxoacyl-[acyl-carrier-protein] synthase-1